MLFFCQYFLSNFYILVCFLKFERWNFIYFFGKIIKFKVFLTNWNAISCKILLELEFKRKAFYEFQIQTDAIYEWQIWY